MADTIRSINDNDNYGSKNSGFNNSGPKNSYQGGHALLAKQEVA